MEFFFFVHLNVATTSEIDLVFKKIYIKDISRKETNKL